MKKMIFAALLLNQESVRIKPLSAFGFCNKSKRMSKKITRPTCNDINRNSVCVCVCVVWMNREKDYADTDTYQNSVCRAQKYTQTKTTTTTNIHAELVIPTRLLWLILLPICILHTYMVRSGYLPLLRFFLALHFIRSNLSSNEPAAIRFVLPVSINFGRCFYLSPAPAWR